jgi:ribosome-associated protein
LVSLACPGLTGVVAAARLRRLAMRSILTPLARVISATPSVRAGRTGLLRQTRRSARLVREDGPINADSLARAIAHVASDAKAADVVVLGISDLTTIADYFVICTADNERQLRAIQRTIDEELIKQGVAVRRVEGMPDSGWVLMDYADVIVHIFGKEQRAFYSLDQLWSTGQPVLMIQ